MTDLINRQAAIDALMDILDRPNHAEFLYTDEICEVLGSLPSAEPVKHEECEYIITKGKAGYHEEYKCSACGDSFYWTQDRYIPRRFNYCRNCGRKVIRFIDREKEE